ncbi:608_t:CDS:1, partial [Gigaspora margarita]
MYYYNKALKWDPNSKIENYRSQNALHDKQKDQVSLTKTSQFMKSKSNSNKENSSGSFTSLQKGTNKEQEEIKKRKLELEDIIEIIIKLVLENIRGCIFDLIKKDPRLKKM